MSSPKAVFSVLSFLPPHPSLHEFIYTYVNIHRSSERSLRERMFVVPFLHAPHRCATPPLHPGRGTQQVLLNGGFQATPSSSQGWGAGSVTE